ncbi:MAG TPA: D-2-hydroxyacid dehydrogenase [Candidatus Acidoferrum sp.]|nr:D-2-hydroxyacid dehydrogenase [Candidatus Acidoferrum sp.]
MTNHTVLVLASTLADKDLALLEQLPPETSLAVGNNKEAFENLAGDADVILSWSLSGPMLREVFGMAPRVKWVHSRSAGLDTVLFPELIASPVPLTNGKGVFSQSLGEFALAGILYFAKDFRRMLRNQEAGRWEQFDVEEISRQTVGIVGYGDIGRACASRAKAMGMRVLAVKRHTPPAGHPDRIADEIFATDDRAAMIAQCDYVVAAAPLTPETRGLVGEREFAAMKPNAVVINVGRGPVIDEAAMLRALTKRRIKGAALDVFDTEPLPAGHPFYSLDNVLLSPHCADHTSDWTEQAMRFFLAQFERYSKGEPLCNVVTKHLGY